MELSNFEINQKPPLNPEMITRFYDNLPLQENGRYSAEVKLFEEALLKPDTAKAIFECKLNQMAKKLQYPSVEEMETVLDVDNQLDSESASRAKLNIKEGDHVFFHSTPVDSLFIDDNDHGKEIWSKSSSRLFWVRDADGNLKEVHTNYPQSNHYSVQINGNEVKTSTVSGLTLYDKEADNPRLVGSDYLIKYKSELTNQTSVVLMHHRPEDLKTSAIVFTNVFEDRLEDRSFKGKIKTFVKNLSQKF